MPLLLTSAGFQNPHVGAVFEHGGGAGMAKQVETEVLLEARPSTASADGRHQLARAHRPA